MSEENKTKKRKQICLEDEIESILNSRLKNLGLRGKINLHYIKEDTTSFYYQVFYENDKEELVGSYVVNTNNSPRHYRERILDIIIPFKRNNNEGFPIIFKMNFIEEQEWLK